MPQMYSQTLNNGSRLMLWHITEPESFFRQAAIGARDIAHPHKRLQHLCSRYLLRLLAPGFPLLNITTELYGKPFLPGHPYHFSVSHCDSFAAAIVSTKQPVGIDVETTGLRVLKIRRKFLTEAEEILLQQNAGINEAERLTVAWSAKETLYKWLGETGVDFKANLQLEQITNTGQHGLIVAKTVRQSTQQVFVAFRLWNGIVLTWSEGSAGKIGS